MKKRINKINILLVASIIGLVLLSGCTESASVKTTSTQNVTQTTVVKTPTPEITPSNLSITTIKDNVSANSGHATESLKSKNSSNSTNSTGLSAMNSSASSTN